MKNNIKNWVIKHEEAIKTGLFCIGMAGVSAVILKIEWDKVDRKYGD
jgi:hypothetical protein